MSPTLERSVLKLKYHNFKKNCSILCNFEDRFLQKKEIKNNFLKLT